MSESWQWRWARGVAHPLSVWAAFSLLCLVIRWTVARCVVALVTGLGQEEVEVPVAGRW